MRFGKWKWVFVAAALLSCRQSPASLVIIVYNNNTLYIGSDSLEVSHRKTRTDLSDTKKIFPFSKTGCAAMTGYIGGTNPRNGEVFDFKAELQRLCDVTLTNGQAIKSNVAFLTNQMTASYFDLSEKMTAAGRPPVSEVTVLTLSGYDDAEGTFFCVGGNLTPTGAGFGTGILRGPSTNFGRSIQIQGLSDFPEHLITSNDPRYAILRTRSFVDVLDLIKLEKPVPENRMTNFMLEIFRLHKENADKFDSTEGQIGPPYVIYKITKTGVTNLSDTARPLTIRTNSP